MCKNRLHIFTGCCKGLTGEFKCATLGIQIFEILSVQIKISMMGENNEKKDRHSVMHMCMYAGCT